MDLNSISDGSGNSSGSEVGAPAELASDSGLTHVTEVTAVRVRALPLEQCRTLVLQAEERAQEDQAQTLPALHLPGKKQEFS